MPPAVPDPRPLVRWAVLHGLTRVVLGRASREGDPQALMITDPAVRADPYPALDALRSRGPLVRGRLSWVSSHHAVCREVLRSEDFGVTGVEQGLPPLLRRVVDRTYDQRGLGPLDPPSLLAVEPPDHTRYRTLVSKVFTPRAVEALRPRVQATADALLDRVGRGRFDLVEQYATLLPVAVIAEILGVPEREHARVLELGNEVAASLDLGLPLRRYLQVHRGLLAFNDWLDQHLARLRQEPGTDLLSQLVLVRDGGARLDPVELRVTAGLVLGAGFETTVNLLGSGARLLLEHPDQLELLRSGSASWANAVEEVLRYESPVQVTSRVAVRDTVVAGTPVAGGQRVTTMLGGANRDPAVFAAPHRFDVTRPNAREHLAFSGGRHFCLGAALARIEGEVGLRTLFERFPGLAMEPGASRRDTRVLRGWERLPATAAS